MKHSDTQGKYGENLYYCSGYEADDQLAVNAVQSWYDEIHDYSFETCKTKTGKAIGHFTQVVWNETKKVGIGMVTSGNTTFVVAQYKPAGNFIGQYKEHVQTLKDKTAGPPKVSDKPPSKTKKMPMSKISNESDFDHKPGTVTKTETTTVNGVTTIKTTTTRYIDSNGDGKVDQIKTETKTKTKS